MNNVEQLRAIHNIHIVAGALELAQNELMNIPLELNNDINEYAVKLETVTKSRNKLLDELKCSLQELEQLINNDKN